MNLASFQPETGSQSVTCSCLDKSQFLKDAEELLVMHKRFELNAVKRMHTYGGLADLQNHCRSFYGSSSTPNVSSSRSRTDKMLQRDRRWNFDCIKDNGYLDHLLPKKEHFQRNVNRNENIESGLLNLHKTSSRLPDRQSNALRLPKFNSLPPENKEIFYTRLSHIPSLPRFPEIKTQTKQTSKKKAPKNRQSNPFQPAENCLQVRALLRNSAERDDSEDDSVRFWKTEKTISLKSAQELFRLQKTDTKKDGSDLAKLGLLSANEKLIQKRYLSNGRQKDVQTPSHSSTNKEPRQPEKAVLEKAVVAKLIPEEKNPAKYDEMKTKRNVRFSECLREIHVYSPLVSSDKSMS